MVCLQTPSHSALVPSKTPPDYSWTDAKLVDLAQICRNLGISEEASTSSEPLWEVNTVTPASPSQATSYPSKNTKLRLKRKATTKPIKEKINAPRRSNGQFQKMNDPISEDRQLHVQVKCRQSVRRRRARPWKLCRHIRRVILLILFPQILHQWFIAHSLSKI